MLHKIVQSVKLTRKGPIIFKKGEVPVEIVLPLVPSAWQPGHWLLLVCVARGKSAMTMLLLPLLSVRSVVLPVVHLLSLLAALAEEARLCRPADGVK